MAKGEPQDQIVSTKNPLPPSWDLGQIKKMACGKNLLDPGEEKKGPVPSHLSPLFSGGQ